MDFKNTEEDFDIYQKITPHHKNILQKMKRIKPWVMLGFYSESYRDNLAADLANWGYLKFIEKRKDQKLTKYYGKESFRNYYKFLKDLPTEKFTSKHSIGEILSFYIKNYSEKNEDLIFEVKKIKFPIIKNRRETVKKIENIEFVFIAKRTNCIFQYNNQWYSVDKELTTLKYENEVFKINFKQSEYINFKI